MNIEVKRKEFMDWLEYKDYPELFSDLVLKRSSVDRVRSLIRSEEFKKYPHLFTSSVLAYSSIDNVKALVHSEEFQTYPDLFTSQVLAHSSIDNVKALIHSEEFQTYPHLFTSTVLAHSSIDKVKDIIHSNEFKEYQTLFTPIVLALATIEDIKKLLNLECWQDPRFRSLLSSRILAESKSMLKKLPLLIKIAEKYGIDRNLNSSYFLKSPSQVYAIICYLEERGQRECIADPFFQEGKLHPFFSCNITNLKKKFNIDLKELIKKYPFDEEKFLREEGSERCL